MALETEPVPETEQARKTEQARNAKPARGTESAGENPAAGTAASEKAGPGGLAKASTKRRGSGRQKHDAKITVYLSGDELVAMEQARLALRASHALAVDRGRIVREAVAVLLADFEARGEDSVLVTRLRDGDLDDQEAAD
nr:cobyrinic acid ac-diamide synthase [Prauserella halophila]